VGEILLFHHVLGLTPGCIELAETLRAGGHVVHTPDLFDGKTFATIDDGLAYVEEELGFETVVERGVAAAGGLPDDVVYAGLSLGVMPAQKLAQTRPGARGAVLLHAAIPPEAFGTWPDGLAAQIHVMEDDDLGDVDVARDIAGAIATVELHLYPGSGHLFTDSSSVDHDSAATALVLDRVLAFLATIHGDMEP
jgi:dienelactone hydrolase